MLKTVQSGRGIAAMAVAAFHLSIELAKPKYLGHPVLEWLTRKGNLGVDFFFVLSGFIIIFAHSGDVNRPRRLGNYATKRFVRLYPIYWLYTIAFCIASLFQSGAGVTLPTSPAAWFSSFSLIRLINFEPPISPAWTLFHEVAFYAIFATLILNKKLGLAAMSLWLIAILCVFRYADTGGRTPYLTYLSAYDLDFFVGMGAWYLLRRGKRWEGWAAMAIGVVLLVSAYAAEASGLRVTALPLLYAMGFGGILAGAALWESRLVSPLVLRTSSLIGNASYSIYLTHLAFESVFSKVMSWIYHRHWMNDLEVYFVILLLTILAGCGCYWLVERPLLSLVRSFLSNTSRNKRGPPMLSARV